MNVAQPPHRSLYRYAWALVGYTIAVVLWGAWVRISHSGDGCGDHWPFCKGEVIPTAPSSKTWVELSHRLSTGVYGFLVLFLIVWVFRTFPSRHPARKWSVLVALFTVTEALIGAKLVVLGLVDESKDLLRLVMMPLHLVNTSLLLMATVMVAEAVYFGSKHRGSVTPKVRAWVFVMCLAIITMLTTGAIASLGSHLDPSGSIISGLTNDFDSSSHLAVRWRIAHPVFGVTVPVLIVLCALSIYRNTSEVRAKMWCKGLVIAISCAAGIGIVTLLTLAPIPLKLVHLAAANLVVVMASGVIFHVRGTTPIAMQR